MFVIQPKESCPGLVRRNSGQRFGQFLVAIRRAVARQYPTPVLLLYRLRVNPHLISNPDELLPNSRIVVINHAAQLQGADPGPALAAFHSHLKMLQCFLQAAVCLKQPVAEHGMRVDVRWIEVESFAKGLFSGRSELLISDMLIEPVGPTQMGQDIRSPRSATV